MSRNPALKRLIENTPEQGVKKSESALLVGPPQREAAAPFRVAEHYLGRG
jgi:hypothetical protein